MSRISRTIIAGGAALALLAGSGATFARWYDEKPVQGAEITAGNLSIDVGNQTWKLNKPNSDSDIDFLDIPLTDTNYWQDFAPAKDKLTPGDVVVISQEVTIHAKGKNLEATLYYSKGDATYPDDVTVDTLDCVKADGTALDLAHITEAQDGTTCMVRTVIAWEQGASNAHSGIPENCNGDACTPGDGTHADDQGAWVNPTNPASDTNEMAMDESISLSGGKLLIEQNRRPAV